MAPSNISLLPAIIGGILSLLCLLMAFRYMRRKRLIDDLPTSKTQGTFIGLTELKGSAESESPLTSYLAGTICVQYEWNVLEHWSRTVHETYTDSQGHTQTRTRQESGWASVARGGEAAPFYLKDDTGVIRIVPDGAKIENIAVFEQTVRPTNPLYYKKGPMFEVANSDHERRFTERAIILHAPLYVMGQARERQDVVAAEIAKDKNSGMYLISMKTEKDICSAYKWWSILWFVFGLGITFLWVWIQGQINLFGSSAQTYMIAAGVYLLVFVLGWVWMVHNGLVSLKQRVRQAWSQVEVQLKRRHDLIDNLVPVVVGYREHERETQALVAELRNQLNTGSGRPDSNLKGLAPSIRLLVESYPDLQGSEIFLSLQKNLSDTESRIALARGYYNDIATFFNSRVQTYPDRFVAEASSLTLQPLMSIESFERAPVQIKLAS